jgi:P4 family phage/plasmid primase-like protien
VDSQFSELLYRLGRTDDDAVTICYQSSVQRFMAKTIKVSLAESTITALDTLSNNIWFEINPSRVAQRATATDITQLAAFYIDIDYKDSGAGSVAKARELVDLLSDLIGVGPSAVVYSGHGIQPYWAVDPEEDFDPVLAQGILNRWGAFTRFIAGSLGIQLDSVFDLPRIFRVPGSRNMKDVSNPVDVIATFPEHWRPVSLDEINEILIAHGITSEMNMPDGFELISSSADWNFAHADCQFTPSLFAGIRPTNNPPKSRHGWLLQQLVLINAAHRNGCLTETTANELLRLVDARFQDFLKLPPKRELNQNEVQSANRWAIARVETFDELKLANELRNHNHSDFLQGDPTSALGEPSANQELSHAELLHIYRVSFGTYGRTDAANARRLIHYTQGNYKFIPDVGWHKWDETRYVFDKEKAIYQSAIEAAEFVEVAGGTGDQLKWAQQSQNKERVVNAITIASTDPDVLVSAMEMDSQPNELCTPAGIVNLQTGELRPAVRGVDLNTRQTTCAPAAVAAPLWTDFLKRVVQDEDRISYLQELLGAALFGDSRYHVLPVLAGSGANGKSTLLDVVSGILGDYAASMPENFLLDANGAAHPTEIARLRGVRFAMASETRPDGKFNESRVKMLTGGDMLSARFMNQNFFDFRPTHTLFLAVNHLPAVKSGGDGFWRRLRKLDFRVTIPKDQQRENFAQFMIQEEGPGILKWMIDGAVRVTNAGFSEPDSVKLSTLEYRHEEDHIAKFLDERVLLASNGTVTKTAIFNSYRDWCIDNGERPITQNALNREVRQRLNTQEITAGGARMFSGIELVSVAMSPERIVEDDREKDEYWR